MKTIYQITRNFLFMSAILAGLQSGTTVAAAHTLSSAVPSKAHDNSSILVLRPVTPSEASFDDGTDASCTTMFFPSLAPVVPSVADFEDEAPQAQVNLQELAPVTPAEAVFEEM